MYNHLKFCTGPIDSCISLSYDPVLNRFYDEDKQKIIHDLHAYMEPWQLLYLKETGRIDGYCLIKNKDGDLLEVFFPYPWSEQEYWENLIKYNDEQENYYNYAMSKD